MSLPSSNFRHLRMQTCYRLECQPFSLCFAHSLVFITRAFKDVSVRFKDAEHFHRMFQYAMHD